MSKYVVLFVKPDDKCRVIHRVIISRVTRYGGSQIVPGRLDGYEFKFADVADAIIAADKVSKEYRISYETYKKPVLGHRNRRPGRPVHPRPGSKSSKRKS